MRKILTIGCIIAVGAAVSISRKERQERKSLCVRNIDAATVYQNGQVSSLVITKMECSPVW